MGNNIIIFGKNSVLAKNFTQKFNSDNFIFISRENTEKSSIQLNIGTLLNKKK